MSVTGMQTSLKLWPYVEVEIYRVAQKK